MVRNIIVKIVTNKTGLLISILHVAYTCFTSFDAWPAIGTKGSDVEHLSLRATTGLCFEWCPERVNSLTQVHQSDLLRRRRRISVDLATSYAVSLSTAFEAQSTWPEGISVSQPTAAPIKSCPASGSSGLTDPHQPVNLAVCTASSLAFSAVGLLQRCTRVLLLHQSLSVLLFCLQGMGSCI